MAERVTIASLVQRGVLVMGDGYRTKRSEHGLPGYRIVRVADVRDGHVFLDGDDFVSVDHVRQMGAKIAVAGDVLLTTKGTVGRVAVMPQAPEPAVYSPQLCYFRILDREVLDPHYLRYWFGSTEFLAQASFLQGNTDMAPYISLTDLRAASMTLPAISEQREIVDVLGALDDRLATNTRLAATSDELAREQFRTLISPSTRRVPLGEIANVTKGVSYRSADLVPSATALVTLKCFLRGGGYTEQGLKSFDGPHKDAQLVAPGEVAVAQTDLTQAAEVIGRAVRVPATTRFKRLVASLDVAIVRPDGDLPSEALLGILEQEDFRTHCRERTSGTTVLHLERGAIESYLAPLPDHGSVQRYAAAAGALRSHAGSVRAENSLLAATRDTLLPQLMSGKLKVRVAAEVAGL